MKFFTAIISLLFCFSLYATTSFEHGTNYTHTSYEGSVLASCDTGTRTHYCSAYDLDPAMYTRLVTSQSLNANKFEVTATHESGKTRSKKGKFKGTQSKPINLWIRTLFQRPLLDFGVNQIDFKILKGSSVVEQGSFEVTVDRGQRRSCRRGYLRLFGNDCENSTRVCDEYFRRGYCRN